MATGLENELIDEEPWYSPLYDNTLVNRWRKQTFSDAFEEGNYPRAALRLGGALGGSVGDILGAPLDLVFEVHLTAPLNAFSTLLNTS